MTKDLIVINPNMPKDRMLELLFKLYSKVTDYEDNQIIIELINEYTYFFKELLDLKYAIDSSTIVAVTDASDRITYVNEKFCHVSKYSKEELIGKTHRLFNSNYHDQLFFKNMWQIISSGQIWEGEIKNKAKDNSYYWVKTTIVPILGANKLPSSYISLNTNITNEKLAEERLRKALKKDFGKTFNALTNLIFKVKKREDGRFVYTMFEGKLSKSIGVNSEHVYGKTPHDLFQEDHASLLDHYYQEGFSGKSVSYKHCFNDVYVYTTLSPIYEGGQVVEVIGSSGDITELERTQQKIERMAYHDPLTDLPNRRRFSKDLTTVMEEAFENEQFVALLYLDLDRFKQINDTAGHTIGDLLLCDVASRLDQVIENNGQIYRLGGDDFLIVLPSLKDKSDATYIANQILLEMEMPFRVTDHEFFITVSIGICFFPEDGDNEEVLLKNADTALNYCKLQGRQGSLIYSKDMNTSFDDYLHLELNLRKAIKKNEFVLYYQPKIDISTGAIIGMEALIRWISPEFGMISPGRFIPVAEDTGLIISLGEWVLKHACSQNQQWIERGFTPRRVAVNVSAIELRRHDFIQKVKRILTETKLDPQYLEIEITENSLMDNSEKSVETLMELKKLGVYLSIDDFGTGYSSLSYLKQFPLHALKIDQSFVRDILVDSSDAAIVKAMIQIAKTFNLTVVAEGVETKEVLDCLQAYKCDEVQGYYYSKPLPTEEFEALLHSSKLDLIAE